MYNSENMREVLNSGGQPIKRVDTFGKMMMKFSGYMIDLCIPPKLLIIIDIELSKSSL
jgi:hypothetical protein